MSLLSNTLLSTPCIVSRRVISACSAGRKVGWIDLCERPGLETYLVDGRKIRSARQRILLICASAVLERLRERFVEGHRAVPIGVVSQVTSLIVEDSADSGSILNQGRSLVALKSQPASQMLKISSSNTRWLLESPSLCLSAIVDVIQARPVRGVMWYLGRRPSLAYKSYPCSGGWLSKVVSESKEALECGSRGSTQTLPRKTNDLFVETVGTLDTNDSQWPAKRG